MQIADKSLRSEFEFCLNNEKIFSIPPLFVIAWKWGWSLVGGKVYFPSIKIKFIIEDMTLLIISKSEWSNKRSNEGKGCNYNISYLTSFEAQLINTKKKRA